jgi:hypothetical protein
MNPLVLLAIQEAPTIIATLKSLFAKAHPGDPEPTNEEVIAAYQQALASSLAKDDDWLSQHPTDN